MEHLLQNIMKLLPDMENHQEEFDRLKSIYERELQELFHIEDLENHNMDLSTTPSKKTDSLRKARDYSGNSIDPRDKMTTDSSNNPIGIKFHLENNSTLSTYHNPFQWLVDFYYPSDNKDDSTLEKPKKSIADWSKRLRFYYRKILLWCHPDKWRKNRRHRSLTFKKSREVIHQAKSAYRKEQYGVLLYLAFSVGISIHKLSGEELQYLQEELDNISKVIKDIESSFPWLWTHQPWCRDKIIEFLKKKHRLIPKRGS